MPPDSRFPWHNTPIVMAAEPGREFAFARTERFAGTLVWRYRFEPEGTGTRVTESYEIAPRSAASAGSSSAPWAGTGTG